MTASAIEDGADGGTIEMRGDMVGQFGEVHADAMGDGDGGNITIYANEVVALSSGSLTTANAAEYGDGGEIIVFSPDTALFWEGARIEAKGGSASGDGGFVEVSGWEHVEVYGLVDASAPSGAAGTFLIDPINNIDIVAAADANGSWDGADPIVWVPDNDNSTVNAATIVTNLGTQNVTITTAGDGVGGQDGNITISANIVYTGDNYLKLSAANDIILNTGTITFSGAGDIALYAGSAATADTGAILNTGNQTITLGSGGLLIYVSSGIGTSANPILTSGLTNVGAVTVKSGGIYISNSGGSDVHITKVELSDPGNWAQGLHVEAGTGDIHLTNTGGGTITQDYIITTDGGLAITAAGTVTLTNASNAVGTLSATISGTSNFSYTNTGALDVLSATTTAGDITIGVISGNLTATLITAGAAGNILLDTTTSGDIIVGDLTADGNNVTLTAAGAITDANGDTNNVTASFLIIDDATTVGASDNALNTTVANITLSDVDGDVYILENDALTIVNCTSNMLGSVDIRAAGLLTVANAGGVTVAANKTITLMATGAGNNLVVNENISTSGTGTIDLSAGADINVGTVAGADVTITAVSGDVTLSGVNMAFGHTVNNVYGRIVTSTGSGNVKLDASGTIDFNTSASANNSGINSGGYLDIDPTDVTIDGAGLEADDYITITATGTVTNNTSIATTVGTANYITISAAVIAQNGTIDTTVAGTEYVTLAATGAITDDGSALITTVTLNITDASAVGTGGNPLVTTIATLNATNVDGGIYIDETNDLTVTNAVAGGVVDIDGAVLAIDTISGTTITLTATGAITDSNANSNINITGVSLVIDAAASIGAADALETQVTSLSLSNVVGATDIDNTGTLSIDAASAAMAGTLDISSSDSLTVGAVITTSGAGDNITLTSQSGSVIVNNAITADNAGGAATVNLNSGIDIVMSADVNATASTVTLNADGAITDDADAATEINATTLTITDATTVGTSGTYLDTKVTNLNMSGVSGASYILEEDAITLLSVNVDGSVSVTTSANAITVTDVDTSNDDVTLVSAAGIALNAQGAISIGSGKATLTAQAGSIEEPDANDTTVDITAGEVDLDATTGIGTDSTDYLNLAVTTIVADVSGAGADIFLTNAPTADATLDAATTNGTAANSDITYSQTGGRNLNVLDATTADGDITISVTSGDLTATSITAGTDGHIDLNTITSGNIIVGDLTASDDNVTLTAIGAISDGNGDSNNITAANLVIGDATTIGASDNALNTTVTNLTLSGISGDIYILENDGLTIVNASSSMGGSLDIRAVGLMTVADGGGVTVAVDKNITLVTTEAGNNLVIDENVSTSGTGTITLTAGGNVTIASAGIALANGGATVTAVNGNVTVTGVDVTLGTNVVTALTDDYRDGRIVTSTGSGDVKIDASGAFLITAGEVVEDTVDSGINSGGYIDIDPTIVTINGDGANDEALEAVDYITITATGAFTNNDIILVTATDGYVTISAASIAQEGDITTDTGSSEYVTLTANTGAITDTTDGTTDISTTTLNITSATAVGTDADATDDPTTTDNGWLDTDVTTLNISGVNGSVFVLENDAADNDIKLGTIVVDLASDEHFAVHAVNGANITIGAVNADAGTVTLNADGTINDADTDSITDITAATIDLDAVDGIGNTAALELAATTIDANTTGTAGGEHIDLSNINANATELRSFSTAGNSTDADITFAQTGGGALTVTSAITADGDITISVDDGDLTAAIVTAGGDGNIILTTTDSGDINVGNVTATGDQINITSAAKIEESGTDDTADLTTGTAILRAATGIGSDGAIETNITTLDAINSISGSIQIIEVADGTDLDINQATQQTAGNIDIRTTNGHLTVVLAQSGVTAVADGTITLVAGNSDGIYIEDLVVNDSVISNRGKITLTSSGDDVKFGADGDVTSTSGEIEVNATSGTGPGGEGVIFMVNGTVLDAGSGIIDLNAYGDITLGSVQTTSTSSTTGSEAVNINSAAGGIVDGGDEDVDVVAADGRLVIDAVTGVGSAGAIETTVGSIDVDNTTSGNIQIDETDAITVIQLDNDMADDTNATTGTISLVADGAITVEAGESGVTAIDGNVTLQADNGASIIVNAVVETTLLGNIVISADDDITFALAGDVTASGSGNITITADDDATGDAGQGGAITMADNQDPIPAAADCTVIDAGSGVIELRADEDITITRLTTTGNTADISEIYIWSGNGAIVDGGDTAVDIDANTGANSSVSIFASTGIGTDANDIDTTVRQLAATTATGDIHIVNADTLTIVNATGYTTAGPNGVTITAGSSSDNITVLASSPLNVNAVVTSASGGDITLAALGNADADDLTINVVGGGDVITTAANGSINLYAGDDVIQTLGDIKAGGTGNVSIYAGEDWTDSTLDQDGFASGAIAMATGRKIQSEDGNITLDAADSVDISLVTANSDDDATIGDVSITSRAADITDIDDDALVNIVADALTLRAVTGIGHGNAIETQVTTVDALNSTSNDILITELAAGGALGINQATQQTAGNVDIRTTNGGLTVVLGQSGVTVVGTGTVYLFADGTDSDLTVNAGVTAATGQVDLIADDSIEFGSAGDVMTTGAGAVNVLANFDDANSGAGTDRIFMANGAVIDGGDGAITLDTVGGDFGGDITLGSIETDNTTASAITIATDAGIIDGGDIHVDIIANTAFATVDLDAVTGIGSANALETSIYNLEARNTTSGNIKIAETDAINLIELINQAAAGSVDVTVAGTITTTTVTSGGAVNLYATAGDIFDTPNGMITAGASSSLKASGIIGTVATPHNPVNVNIGGDLWVGAGKSENQVSVILEGYVNSSSETERVEIYKPSPPGLVMLDNRLMGGGNYGSGSVNGSILSRGFGETLIVRTDMFSLFYDRATRPWGHKISTSWLPFEGYMIDNDFLNGPIGFIDASQLNLKPLPPEFFINPEKAQYYIIRAKAK